MVFLSENTYIIKKNILATIGVDMDDFFNEPFFAENVDDLNRAFHNLLSPVKNIETGNRQS